MMGGQQTEQMKRMEQMQTVRPCLADVLALETALAGALELRRGELEGVPAASGEAERWRVMAAAQRDVLSAHIEASGLGGVAASDGATAALDGLLEGGTLPGTLRRTTLLWRLHSAFHHMAMAYGLLWVISHRAYSERRDEPTFRMAERHQKGYMQAAQELAALMPEVVGWELSQQGEACQCLCPTCSGIGACICITGGRSLTVDATAETLVAPERGVRLWQPRPGAPGDRAGLREGDVVTAIDGQELPDVWKITAMLKPLAEGRSVRLRVERGGGAAREVTVAP